MAGKKWGNIMGGRVKTAIKIIALLIVFLFCILGAGYSSAGMNYNDNQSNSSKTKVEIYTTSWCPYCKKAKEYLVKKGVAYLDHDIERDKDALRRRDELASDGGVPVAVINGKVIVGFIKEEYDAALEKNK